MAISDVGQKGVIQDGVEDGRRTLIRNITSSGVMNWCLYPDFWGQGNHFQGEKVAGSGEFQNGRLNGRRALSVSLSRFITELVE